MNAKGGLRRLSIAVNISVVVSAFQAASPASAADLTVVCPGGGPGAYPTIPAALNAITNNEGPNSISVSGTCTENVVIFNQNNLYIHNAPGSTAVITNAASPAQITVQLFGSRLVTFDGLSIQGGNPGLFMNQGSDLQMFNSVLEKNVGDGATVLIKSDLNFGVSCIIRNNGGNGLLIGDSSLVVVMSPTQILNNNGSGVNVFSSGYIKFQSSGGHLIAGNAGAGILAEPDGHVFLQSPVPTVVRNNGGDGLVFRQGCTTITGHRFGVGLSSGGELTFDGPHQITGNGNLANEGGMQVERSSLTLLNGATVSNNVGPGILGDAHSGIVLGPTASVTNNSSTGIRLRHQSLVGLTAPVAIQGNGGGNIACDSTSLAYGQLAGVTGVQCGE